MNSRLLSISLRLSLLIVVSATAGADCVSPSAEAGTVSYFTPLLKFCDGAVWRNLSVTNTGTACAVEAGTIARSGTDLRFCNGTNWISTKGTQTNGTCTAGEVGKFRYSSAQAWMEFCDGGNWTAMQSSAASIAWVQARSNNNSTAGATVSTGNFSSAATAGNMIVCAVDYSSSAQSVSSVTDTKGNTYAKAVGPVTGAGGLAGWRIELWYALNIAGGTSFNVTATLNASISSEKIVSCHEYSGVATVAALDKTATNSGSGTSYTAGPVTTASSKEMMFVYFAVAGGTPAPSGGATQRSIFLNELAADKMQNTVGSYSLTATNAFNGNWMSVLATFRGQ